MRNGAINCSRMALQFNRIYDVVFFLPKRAIYSSLDGILDHKRKMCCPPAIGPAVRVPTSNFVRTMSASAGTIRQTSLAARPNVIVRRFKRPYFPTTEMGIEKKKQHFISGRWDEPTTRADLYSRGSPRLQHIY